MYTVIQAVHSLIYIVAKCHFFSVVTLKDIIKYLQKCEGCTHFCEILYTDFSEIVKGILGIIHYMIEDHTLPDFKVVLITTNSLRNMSLVARRRVTNKTICVLKSAENIKHFLYPPTG